MSRVLTVAVREFKHTVMTKAFILGIVGVPILIVGILAVSLYMMKDHKAPPLVGTVAVVDAGGRVAEAARLEFDPRRIQEDAAKDLEEIGDRAMRGEVTMSPGGPVPLARGEVRVDVETHESADHLEQLKQRLRDGDLLAAAVVDPSTLSMPGTNEGREAGFTLYVAERIKNDHVNLIESRLGKAIVRARLGQIGEDPERMAALTRAPNAQTLRLLASGEESEESEGLRELQSIGIPMAFMMLLWIATFTSGQHLMMSTIEEKSNKVVEVLLSAVSPFQLMAGKIIGQGGVGLLIVALYSSLGLAALGVLAYSNLIQPMQLVYLGVYFFMAYFMVASIMAAVGSAVSDIREANSLLAPVMIVLMVPLILWMPISQAPNGTVATIFSFIPPAIPFAMILRVTADETVPPLQILLTISWGYFCVLAMIWMAARVFRVGVLMQGKPPSPIELMKWMRYS